MQREYYGSGDTSLVSFLAGAVIGAAAALLLAPRSGRETRELLFEQAAELGERIKEKADDAGVYREDLVAHGKEMIERGRELVKKGTELAQHGRDFVGEKKHILTAAIEAGKEAMRQEKENLSRSMEPEAGEQNADAEQTFDR